MSEKYTEEDIDLYVEYARALYLKVMNMFMPSIEVKNQSDDVMDKYLGKMGELLTSTAPAIDRVYSNILEPFGMWLYHDCPITKHKGRIREVRSD